MSNPRTCKSHARVATPACWESYRKQAWRTAAYVNDCTYSTHNQRSCHQICNTSHQVWHSMPKICMLPVHNESLTACQHSASHNRRIQLHVLTVCDTRVLLQVADDEGRGDNTPHHGQSMLQPHDLHQIMLATCLMLLVQAVQQQQTRSHGSLKAQRAYR